MALIFKKSQPFTLGVELELQLLDPRSMNLVPQGPALLALISEAERPRIKAEFIRSMVEICTPVCADMEQVADQLSRLCRRAEELAGQVGACCHAASLHPFALVKERHISPGLRYDEIMADLQLAGRRMITQALHVHVGVTSAATAIKVCDGVRAWLPLLLALSGSSPLLEGEDTGFASYRTNLFGCLPRTGMPATLGSWNNFQDIIATLNKGSILSGIKELWWDVRPHPDFGTVEIRICDLPSRFSHILGLTGLSQALVAWLAEEERQEEVPLAIINQSRWHAARYGLDGNWLGRKGHLPFSELVPQLLEKLQPLARELGSLSYLDGIRDICAQGNSSSRQRQLLGEGLTPAAMIQQLRQEFWS
ncbi:MAG: YbdK family carboxylate-amine ligase [Thermodesulfobacteriota bacterium]